jgi:tRNA(Ile)-lysidine synthase
MSTFIKTIQNTAHAHKLWSRGSKILVGVSGGPDSVCLLDILVFLSKKYDWQLRIAHVNYGLRDQESIEDEHFVRALAKRYHIPCSVITPTITEQSNLEERLRDIRYDFFETIRQKYHFNSIAIAHSQDDQAETMLMRLIRGSGLAGLRAMQPKTSHIIRPLLETSRADILQYLDKHALTYRIDQSNADTKFLRNDIRHNLLPYLQEHYNPAIKEVLANTASIISEDYEALHVLTESCLLPFSHIDNAINFQRDAFLAFDTSMQKMLLRKFFTIIQEDTKGITSAHIQESLKCIASPPQKLKSLSFAHVIITINTKGSITIQSKQ